MSRYCFILVSYWFVSGVFLILRSRKWGGWAVCLGVNLAISLISFYFVLGFCRSLSCIFCSVEMWRPFSSSCSSIVCRCGVCRFCVFRFLFPLIEYFRTLYCVVLFYECFAHVLYFCCSIPVCSCMSWCCFTSFVPHFHVLRYFVFVLVFLIDGVTIF